MRDWRRSRKRGKSRKRKNDWNMKTVNQEVYLHRKKRMPRRRLKMIKKPPRSRRRRMPKKRRRRKAKKVRRRKMERRKMGRPKTVLKRPRMENKSIPKLDNETFFIQDY